MHYKFFSNRECEFFPCHKGISNDDFNCLFCFCPLYHKKDCGGNYIIVKGIKDCSNCRIPHIKENYDHIIDILNKEGINNV